MSLSKMTLASACFQFNSKQNDVFSRQLDQICVTFSTPEGNNVTFTGKIAR